MCDACALCRLPVSAVKGEASLSSSSMSVRDILRQRYSVTWHPRLLYLIVSDGYMATVMRVLDTPSPAVFLKTLLKDVSKDLEKASCTLHKSQVINQSFLTSEQILKETFSLYGYCLQFFSWLYSSSLTSRIFRFMLRLGWSLYPA